jgi:hypothetical protein
MDWRVDALELSIKAVEESDTTDADIALEAKNEDLNKLAEWLGWTDSLDSLESSVRAGDSFQEAFANCSESEEATELAALLSLEEEASASRDWIHGEALIRESYFTDYIEELINDCYSMPKEMTSGEWPWRHVTVDYEAAAEDAKVDYIEVDFDGVTYLIRSC